MSLDEIGKQQGTDKSSNYHDYLRYYEKFIDIQPKHILEIGILDGSSLRMWREHFKCLVYGVDIAPTCKQHQARGIRVRIGSQDDEEFLTSVCDEILPAQFDLIIDDASHMAKATTETFRILFPWLAPGGIYICEDTCCSYWEEFVDCQFTPIRMFKRMVDNVNLHGMRDHGLERGFSFLEERDPEKAKAYLYEYMVFINSAVIIKKRGR